ncbi:MAG: ribonuclease III [Nitriliruptorales bacterium]
MGQRFADLEHSLGVRVGDDDLLKTALTHRSYAFEHGGLATNERLEFLGDAVLALVVTDFIFHELPDAAEGRLAKLRAAAVRTSVLAEVGREVGLGAFVRLGKGERASGGADKESILADTFEAVLGAIYLARGFEIASQVVRRLFADRLRQLATRGAALDYKTSLQELAAARFNALPVYDLEEEGPDHAKRFTARVRVGGDVFGGGTGHSKKLAEQAAAREAYRRLRLDGWDEDDAAQRRGRRG